MHCVLFAGRYSSDRLVSLLPIKMWKYKLALAVIVLLAMMVGYCSAVAGPVTRVQYTVTNGVPDSDQIMAINTYHSRWEYRDIDILASEGWSGVDILRRLPLLGCGCSRICEHTISCEQPACKKEHGQ